MDEQKLQKLYADYLAGKLEPEVKLNFEEAMKRGLIPPPPATMSGFGGVPVGGQPQVRDRMARALDPSGYPAVQRYGGVQDPPGEGGGRGVPPEEMAKLLATNQNLPDMDITGYADTETRRLRQQMPQSMERGPVTKRYPEGNTRGDVSRRESMDLPTRQGSSRYQPVRRKANDPLVRRSRGSLMDAELLEMLTR